MRVGVSRTAAVGFAVVVAVLVLAATAQARTKTRTPIPPSDYSVTGFCPFTVHVHDLVGRQVETDTFDAGGNLIRSDFHGALVSDFTNVETHQSARLNQSGPVTITHNADGSITIVARGRSITGDQGHILGDPFLTYNSGRVVIRAVPNSQTGFLDFTSITRTGHTTDVCAALSG